MVKADRLKVERKNEEEENQKEGYCQYHDKTADHSIQECPKFLEIIHEMMNRGKIEFCGKMREQGVSVLLEEVRKPMIIFYRGGGQ